MQPTGEPVARNNEDDTDEFCTRTHTHGGNRRQRMVKSPCNCRRETKEVGERASTHLLPNSAPAPVSHSERLFHSVHEQMYAAIARAALGIEGTCELVVACNGGRCLPLCCIRSSVRTRKAAKPSETPTASAPKAAPRSLAKEQRSAVRGSQSAPARSSGQGP